MRIILQRVRRASVTVFDKNNPEGFVSGQIGPGLVLLVGFKSGDTVDLVSKLAQKVVELRIFEDEQGKMNKSLVDIGGSLLVISQFTLYGDTKKGRRPGFSDAMPPDEAKSMYNRLIQLLNNSDCGVETGVFGAKMEVEIINDGPVTFILEDELSPSK